MQDQEAKPAPIAPPSDSIDLVAQTRSLRRKVIFWRRIAWLLLSGFAIIAVILWQRGEMHRRGCRTALAYYYGEAQKIKLQLQPLDLIETEWRSMRSPTDMISSYHYNLIARNWQTQPREGEKLPLAICRDAHSLLLGQGRHVLSSGGEIDWITNEQAEPILQAAQRDDGR